MDRIQWVSILGSGFLLVLVLEMVRSRRLQEQYSFFWIFTGAVLLLLSVWRDLLDRLALLLGIHAPPNALFLVGFGFLLMILLHFSLVLSSLSERTKKLAQEISLLKEERLAERRGGGAGG
jgi:hypothetical protein